MLFAMQAKSRVTLYSRIRSNLIEAFKGLSYKLEVDPAIERSELNTDFIRRSFLGVAFSCLIGFTPFAINNFIQGRLLLGFGSLAIILIFAFSAFTIVRYKVYYATLTLLALVPAIIYFLIMSISRQGLIGVFWCYPAVVSYYFMLPERKAWLANALFLIIILPQVVGVLEVDLALRAIATLVMISVFSAIFVRVIGIQHRKLQLKVATDPLTGLFNRSLLLSSLERAVEQSRRADIDMSLLALDIDHFKSINDTFGHDAGDDVLRRLAGFLKKRIRRADRVFRLGGEEFLIMLYNTGLEDAYGVASELCETVPKHSLLKNHTVTLSIGVATLQEDEDWAKWMKRSDENLYRAKEAGRNRVVA